MPTGGHGDDTAPAALTGAAAGPVRRFTPPAPPRHLQAALATLDDAQYGPKVFENLGLLDFTPHRVVRVGDLLKLRSYVLTQLGPRFIWLIKHSVVEWPNLSAEEKKLHTVMRKSFLTSYAFGAETIIQHWFWKTLKNATSSFGPLLKVFAADYAAIPACGTDAWEQIFNAFPCAETAITHQLIVSGFQDCVSIDDDTTDGFTKYMARLNKSLVQLSTVKPMALSEIYALAALMGLHLSESSRHEHAYSDLMTFIDEGNALTLEDVLRIGLKYSRDRPSTSSAYRAMRDADVVCNCACPLCCKRGRSPHPASCTSSRASSRRSQPKGVSAFLSNLLTDRGIKPTGVLRAAGLSPDDMNDPDVVQALYEASSPYMPATVASDVDEFHHKMGKYEKKRSARRSTPRYPITMASTAETPDPMPCALAAILLQASSARLMYAKRLVSGGVLGACRDMCVRAVPACRVHGCGVDARREPGHQHGCGEAMPVDAGGRRVLVGSPVAATQTRVGIDRASVWGAGRHGVFPQCGVGHAWTLGLVRRPVALSGLLRRSPSGP